MALQFRKRIKILPGVYLNASKSGVSVSAGPRGAKINVGSRGTTLSAGIPGTGIYARQKISNRSLNTKNKITREQKYAQAQQVFENRSADANHGYALMFGVLVLIAIAWSIYMFYQGRIGEGIVIVIFGIFMFFPYRSYSKQYRKKYIEEHIDEIAEELNDYCHAMSDAETIEELDNNFAEAYRIMESLKSASVLLNNEKPEEALSSFTQIYQDLRAKFEEN